MVSKAKTGRIMSRGSRRTQIAVSSMRGPISGSLMRTVSSTPSRLPNTSSLVKRQIVVPQSRRRGRADGVAGDLLIRRMRGAVDLDGHSRFEAGEVGDGNLRTARARGLARSGARRWSHCAGGCVRWGVNLLGMAWRGPHKGGGDARAFRPPMLSRVTATLKGPADIE